MSVFRTVFLVSLLIICIGTGPVAAATEGVVHFPISGITVSPGDPDFVFDENDETPIIKVTGFDFSIPAFVSLFLNLFNLHDLPVWAPEAIPLLIAVITGGGVVLSVRRKLSDDPASRPMQILAAICGNPGCREADLIKATGFSRGSVSYNLRRLYDEKKIRNFSGRYYPAGTSPSPQDDPGWKLLEHERPREIFQVILASPGISQTQISERTGIPVTTLRWHLSQLQKSQVITLTKTRNITSYTAAASFACQYRSMSDDETPESA